MYEIVDLSQEIYTGQPRFPGHPPTELKFIANHGRVENEPIQPKGMTYAAMILNMCDHGPTHTDSVSHIDERPTAPTIEKSPLSNFFTRGIALDFTGQVEPLEEITLKQLQDELAKTGLTPPEGGTVLFTAGHFRRTYPKDPYITDYPGLSYEAAELLYRECGVINIGQDAPSIDAGKNTGKLEFPCHLLCRELQRHNTENLCNIEEVAGKEFLYAGLPLRIREGSGSPVRAVAVLNI
ncbi:MAG: cyclase family protein [bacterium]|nr:cyclase family protein [bacterium]